MHFLTRTGCNCSNNPSARVYYQCTRDLFGLADLLGHSNVNVTRIYTQNTGKIYQRQPDKMQILRI